MSYFECCSHFYKLVDLNSLGSQNGPSIIVLKKTWLTSSIDDDEIPFKSFAAFGPTVSKYVVISMVSTVPVWAL